MAAAARTLAAGGLPGAGSPRLTHSWGFSLCWANAFRMRSPGPGRAAGNQTAVSSMPALTSRSNSSSIVARCSSRQSQASRFTPQARSMATRWAGVRFLASKVTTHHATRLAGPNKACAGSGGTAAGWCSARESAHRRGHMACFPSMGGRRKGGKPGYQQSIVIRRLR